MKRKNILDFSLDAKYNRRNEEGITMKEKKQDNLGLEDERLAKLADLFDLDALLEQKEEKEKKKSEKDN